MAYSSGALLNKKWTRPSLIVFSTTEPFEGSGNNANKWDFKGGTTLYLTDDNRSPLQINPERIEYKRRMIDGTMRSYHVADKNSFSTSWSDIPSRKGSSTKFHTSDAFGAGLDIKNWHEANTGDFWMLLVYDTNESDQIAVSAEKYNVFFQSFDFSVSKRGQDYDLWNVNISLVEV